MSCAITDYQCLVNNCSGGIGSGTVLFDYWANNNCPAAYEQLVNTNSSGVLAYNPVSQALAQADVVNLFNTYAETNTLTDDVTSPSFNTFQNTLLELCTSPSLPGICSQYLNGYCANFSRMDAINSPTLRNFCGCYVPPDPIYLTYTLGSPGCEMGTGCTAGCTAGQVGCTGQPACDPLCHNALTSQKAYFPTGNIISCPQSICVLDDITISVASSFVAGGINFNSICAGCGGASGGDGCLCIISGVNISSVMSNVGIGADFNQFCSGSSVCLVEDQLGNIISEGGCTGINPANAVSAFAYAPNPAIVFIIILVVFLIFFICVAIRFTDRGEL